MRRISDDRGGGRRAAEGVRDGSEVAVRDEVSRYERKAWASNRGTAHVSFSFFVSFHDILPISRVLVLQRDAETVKTAEVSVSAQEGRQVGG